MPAVTEAVEAAINALVDANRTRCLWFLRGDYYPTSPSGRLRVLDCIQRYGDREAARQAAALRQWLLQHSSGDSAAS